MTIATALPIRIAIAFLLFSGASLTVSANAQDKLPKKNASKSAAKSLTNATTDESSAPAAASGESLKFNTETSNPPSSDTRPPMQFSDPGATPLGEKAPVFAATIPEDEPYKAYLGFPKNRVGAFLAFKSLSSLWNYNGRDYNFPNSPLAYGINYAFLITPTWSVGVDYSRYTLKLNAANILPYRFNASTASYDEYYFKVRYCVVSHSSFYRQFCPGIDIGNDSYPIVKFEGANDLYLSKVQDIIIGLNLNWQIPINDSWGFKANAGYNYGTGMGNTGALTSKNNNSLVAGAGVEYQFPRLHSVSASIDYKSRSAKIKGVIGNNTDTWTTKSSDIGVKVGYNITWP